LTAPNLRIYPECPYGFQRYGLSDQPCGSPKLRRNSLWPASAAREQNFTVISAGTTIRLRGGGHHHLSSPAGPILRAPETAVPMEGAVRSPDSHARGDRRSQSVAVPETDQKPRPGPAGRLTANHLDQPAYPRKYSPLLPAIRRSCWTPRPNVQTASWRLP
jgi:hypothetical protein